jgi:hypothetical protein
MNNRTQEHTLPLWDVNADYDKHLNSYVEPFDIKYTPANDVIDNFVAENKNLIANSQSFFTQKYQALFATSEFQNNTDFKIEEYKNIENNIIYKSIFVYLFIIDHINDKDWELEIINYIDYVTVSFGRLPNYTEYAIGLFDYVELVSKAIIDSDFEETKKTFILNYLSEIEEKVHKEKGIMDIIDIYNSWKKTITFDLSFFKRFKEIFDKGIVLTKENYKANKYLKLNLYELLSKEEVIEILYDFTTQIIEALHKDIYIYFKEGFKEFKDKEMANFLLSKYKIDGLKLPNEINSEYDYTKAIRDWFANLNILISALNSAIKNSFNSSQIKGGRKTPVINDAYNYVHYKSNSGSITELYNFLKTNNFISNDTTNYYDLHNIFNNKIPNNKIIWIDGTSSFFYFIKEIHKLGLVKAKTKKYKWEIASKLFLLKDKSGDFVEIDPKKMKSMKEPVNTDILDKAINLLKV